MALLHLALPNREELIGKVKAADCFKKETTPKFRILQKEKLEHISMHTRVTKASKIRYWKNDCIV